MGGGQLALALRCKVAPQLPEGERGILLRAQGNVPRAFDRGPPAGRDNRPAGRLAEPPLVGGSGLGCIKEGDKPPCNPSRIPRHEGGFDPFFQGLSPLKSAGLYLVPAT